MTRSLGLREPRQASVAVPCVICGKVVMRWPSLLKLQKRVTCSRACQAKLWPGVSKRQSGYLIQRAPGHPNARDGYVRQHRLVAEKKIGRRLRSDEVVHHLNHDRADNRPENLEVMTRSAHQRHHQRERGKKR